MGNRSNRWLLFGLAGWLVVNLLQAAFSGLANDEAYYYIYSLLPAWGYFDHPPVTGWLAWLGTHLFGVCDFGVRFFFVLLQPVYLYIFYRLICPAGASARDGWLFFVICAAMPILQLYGFIAVPDGPLLFSAALFLLCFKRFLERGAVWDAVFMGASVALMAYCKYHGALVLLFALAANPRQLLNWRLYLAGAVALVLLIPHLAWQSENDWVSMGYHLSGRNKVFRYSYIYEYLLNMLAVFNPLFWPVYVRGWKARGRSTFERTVWVIGAGLLVFFLLSSLRGSVQPQWTIVSVFMFAMLAFGRGLESERTRRYLLRTGYVTLALVALFRIEMIFNPLGIKFEVFDNRASYGAIAEVAAGRPVIFGGNYAVAAKYAYYTSCEAYCQPNLLNRSSQWQLMDNDSRMAGREVLVEDYGPGSTEVTLANGRKFGFLTVGNFHPVRLVAIAAAQEWPVAVKHTEGGFDMEFSIENPYGYPVRIDAGKPLTVVWGRQKRREFIERAIALDTLLQPRSRTCVHVRVPVPQEAAPGEYSVGLTLKNPPLKYWYNSTRVRITLEE